MLQSSIRCCRCVCYSMLLLPLLVCYHPSHLLLLLLQFCHSMHFKERLCRICCAPVLPLPPPLHPKLMFCCWPLPMLLLLLLLLLLLPSRLLLAIPHLLLQ